MNTDKVNNRNTRLNAKTIQFPGLAITWAGEDGHGQGFAFGTENGYVWISGIHGPQRGSMPQMVAKSGEAINGLAFAVHEGDEYIAASTRAEVLLHKLAADEHRLSSTALQCGAHGVYPTAWGGFLAPLGRNGLVYYYLGAAGTFSRKTIQGENACACFYKLSSLGVTREGEELWAVADRSSGQLVVLIDRDGEVRLVGGYQSKTNPVDFIGVCSVRNSDLPRALISLGRDGSIHFRRDLMGDRTQQTLTFPEMKGTAYSVVSAQGHLLILTSYGLYSCPNMVSRFLIGEGLGGIQKVRCLPREAIDCFLAYDEWLLLIEPSQVIRIQVSSLFDGSAQPIQAEADPGQVPFRAESYEASTSWGDVLLDNVSLDLATVG